MQRVTQRESGENVRGRTNVVVPLDAQVSMISQASFEDVEAVMTARLDVTQALTNWAHSHAHHGFLAFDARLQLVL